MDTYYYDDLTRILDDSAGAKLLRMVQSSILFAIAFIISTYLYQFLTGLAALAMGYDPVVSYAGLFNLPTSYTQWTKWSILITYGSGPLLCVIASVLFFQFYNAMISDSGLLKVFFLWMSVCCANIFLAYGLGGTFGVMDNSSSFYDGFAVVGAWLNMHSVFMSIFAIVCGLLLLTLGYMSANAFLMLSFSYRLANNKKGRRQLLTQLFFVPWLLGSAIIMLVSFFVLYPENFSTLISSSFFTYTLIKIAGVMLVGIGMLFKLPTSFRVSVGLKYDIFKKFSIVLLIAFAVLVAAIYMYERFMVKV